MTATAVASLPAAETAADLTPASAAKSAPKAPPLSDRQWAIAYRRENNITKAGMADQIGYSRSTYSRWEDGSYSADAAQLDAAVRGFRDRVEGDTGVSSVIGFRETAAVREVFAACKKAKDGEMMVILSESGEGKTTALREFRDREIAAHRVAPLYIEATVFTSAFALVNVLASELGLRAGKTPDGTLRQIVTKLRRTRRIILLDEAHYAQEKAVEMLRQIRDQSGVGCVLAGTCSFAGIAFGKLEQSDVLTDLLSHRPHLEQLTSRAHIWKLSRISNTDIEGIARTVLGPCTPGGLERLHQRVERSMRRLVRLVNQIRSTRERLKHQGPVDEALVEASWYQMYQA